MNLGGGIERRRRGGSLRADCGKLGIIGKLGREVEMGLGLALV